MLPRLLMVGCVVLAAGCPNPQPSVECDGGSCDTSAVKDPPRIYVAPPFGLGFDCVTLGCMQVQTFQVKNNGDGTVRIKRVALTSQTSQDFLVLQDASMPVDVKRDAPVTFSVKYQPGDATADTGSVRITYELDPQQGPEPEPVELPLRTRTLGSPKSNLPEQELNFGYVAPGELLTKDLVVENASAAVSVLMVSAGEFEDGSDDAFTILSAFPTSANTGASLTVRVRFAPPLDQASARTFRGVLHLHTNDGAHPDLPVAVIGTARRAPQMVVEPEASASVLDLGSTGVGGTLSATVFIRNTGGTNLTVLPRIINGDGAGFTTEPLTGALPAVEPFTRSPLVVHFTAAHGGPALSTGQEQPLLRLQTNDPDHPVINIQLRGFGILPQVQPSSDSVDFGVTVTGWMVDPRTITIRNTGAGPLNIQDVFLEPGTSNQYRLDAVAGLPKTLLPEDAPVSITIHFSPVVLGAASGNIVIQSDDPDEPLRKVRLGGRGSSCEEGCPLPNATPDCLSGTCQILACTGLFHDADQKDINGCECREDDGGDVGHVCGGGERYLGEVPDDGSQVTASGSLHGGEDQDTYWFFAKDEGGAGQLFGDDFDVRVDLTSAPSGVEMCVKKDTHDVQGQGCGRGIEQCGIRSWSLGGSYGSDDNTDVTIKVRFTPGTAPFCAAYSLRAKNG